MIYNLKSKYRRLQVSEARRRKDLESENTKLEWSLAVAVLDQATPNDLLAEQL